MDAYLNRRAYLEADGRACRNLWAAVAVSAIDEAALEVGKLLEDGARPAVAKALDQFARWIRSRDGREVMENAGIDYSDRTVGRAIAIVAAGRTSNHRPMGGFKGRA